MTDSGLTIAREVLYLLEAYYSAAPKSGIIFNQLGRVYTFQMWAMSESSWYDTMDR
jgi:hypothetical protein